MAKLKVGLIGCGAIGMEIRRALTQSEWAEVCGVLLRPAGRSLASLAAAGAPVVHGIEELLAAQPDIVVECAGHEAVDAYAGRVLEAGCDLMVVSVGALASSERFERLKAGAASNQCRVFIPAGAIGGLDFLQGAQLAGLHTVRYRSRKPPLAWRGSPAEALVDLDTLPKAHTFYRGSAREAATQFPKNANVAATLAFATLGLDDTQVELVADPQAAGNFHEIDAEGEAGSISLRIQAKASPNNPRTSMITAYSVIHALQRNCATIVI